MLATWCNPIKLHEMISLIYEDGEKTLVWRRVTNPSQKLPQFNPCSRFRFSFYIISSVGVSAYLRLWMDLSYIEYAILRGLQNKIILRAKQRERKNKEIICSAKSIFSTLSSFCKQRHSEHFHVFRSGRRELAERWELFLNVDFSSDTVYSRFSRPGAFWRS